MLRHVELIPIRCPSGAVIGHTSTGPRFTPQLLYNHHHLSRGTSTAGHRPPPKFSTTIGPALRSSGFPRPSPDRRSTLWGAYQRCISRYAGAISPNGRQSSSQFALPTATWGLQVRRAMSVTLVLLRMRSIKVVRCRQFIKSCAYGMVSPYRRKITISDVS
jgi:hypothetical protein